MTPADRSSSTTDVDSEPTRSSRVSSDDVAESRGYRSAEIDIYRGLAVIGVVFSHVLDGVTNAGLLSVDSPLNDFNSWLYQFRMPAIALVIGLFIARGVEKYGAGGYIRRRLVYAVYLYARWPWRCPSTAGS